MGQIKFKFDVQLLRILILFLSLVAGRHKYTWIINFISFPECHDWHLFLLQMKKKISSK